MRVSQWADVCILLQIPVAQWHSFLNHLPAGGSLSTAGYENEKPLMLLVSVSVILDGFSLDLKGSCHVFNAVSQVFHPDKNNFPV